MSTRTVEVLILDNFNDPDPGQRCDFCDLQAAVTYRLPAVTITGPSLTAADGAPYTPSIQWASDDGRWAACSRCERLIDGGHRYTLVCRAARAQLKALPLTRADKRAVKGEVFKFTQRFVDQFFDALGTGGRRGE